MNDLDYLHADQPTDSAVKLDLDIKNDLVILRIFVDQERISIPMDVDDARKLSVRIHAAAKMLRGELRQRNTKNAN